MGPRYPGPRSFTTGSLRRPRTPNFAATPRYSNRYNWRLASSLLEESDVSTDYKNNVNVSPEFHHSRTVCSFDYWSTGKSGYLLLHLTSPQTCWQCNMNFSPRRRPLWRWQTVFLSLNTSDFNLVYTVVSCIKWVYYSKVNFPPVFWSYESKYKLCAVFFRTRVSVCELSHVHCKASDVSSQQRFRKQHRRIFLLATIISAHFSSPTAALETQILQQQLKATHLRVIRATLRTDFH